MGRDGVKGSNIGQTQLAKCVLKDGDAGVGGGGRIGR